MDWIDYREKLGIGFNDAQKVKYFRINLFNFLHAESKKMCNQITENEYFKFCNMTGTDFQRKFFLDIEYLIDCIVDIIENDCKTLEELLAYYRIYIVPSAPEVSIPIFVFQVRMLIKYHQRAFPF